MRILFHMLPEPGHLNPTFPLARALTSRGHEVVYTSLLDLQPAIEARGFRCICLHRDIVRRGRLAEIDELWTDEERNTAWGQIRDRVEDEYFDGTMEAEIRAVDPAIIIADIITFSPLQYVSHRLGIPCLQISTSLSQRHDELPPLTSALLPQASRLERETARWESSVLRIVGAGGVPVVNMMTATADSHSARFGYPSRHISFKSVFTPALTLFPELVLCASALDFPRASAEGPSYLATPVDLDRREQIPPELESFIDGKRPLIYASLGSQSGRYTEANRFFRAVVETMRARPDWQAVITTGHRFYDCPVFAELPPNILLLRSAPQLWLLRRASVFVTHAGLGGIREAVALGAPLIAVPQHFDQIGNATRVEFHEIGVQIPGDAVSSVSLTSALERVLLDRDSYKERLVRLDKACRDEEVRQDHFELIERMGDRTRASSSPVSEADRAPEHGAVRGWLFVGASGFVTLPSCSPLEDTRDQPIGIGAAGFTICPDLLPALLRAGGPLLARVEVSGDVVRTGPHVAGRTLRCLWSLDLGEVLCDYAMWCAEQAFESEMPAQADTAEAFRSLLRQYHAMRRSGASREALLGFFRPVLAEAAPLWHHGMAAGATAAWPRLHEAARRAHRSASRSLARKAVGTLAGTPEGADIYARQYHVIGAKLAAELDRRIREHVRAAKLEVDPVAGSR